MKLKSTKISEYKTETYLIDNSDLKVIKNYVDNELTSISIKGNGPHKSSPVIVKNTFKEFIKKSNPFHDYDKTKKHIEGGFVKNRYWKGDLSKIDIDKAIKNGLLYFFYTERHILFDCNGKIILFPGMELFYYEEELKDY